MNSRNRAKGLLITSLQPLLPISFRLFLLIRKLCAERDKFMNPAQAMEFGLIGKNYIQNSLIK